MGAANSKYSSLRDSKAGEGEYEKVCELHDNG